MMKRIFVCILFFLVCQYSQASESIISALVIDNVDEREIEVVMNKNQMYLPCKYILGYLQIPYKENHVEKSLYFKNACIKNGTLYLDGAKQNYQSFFLKNGITGIKNEFFLPATALAQITEKDISSDSNQLIAFITSEKTEEEPKNINENPFLVKEKEEKIQAYQEVTIPKEKGWISLDSIGVMNNTMTDSYSQIYKDSKNTMMSFNNNSRITLAGKLKSGDYKVDLGTNSYTSNLLAFSGISPQYKKHFDRYDYVLGKADCWSFGSNSFGGDVMGLQVKNHVDQKTGYREIQGNVDPKSTVKIYINNDFEKELCTYGGFYSLKDIYYNGKVEKVRVEELLPDGTKKTVLTREFKGGGDDEEKKILPENDIILGLSGVQDRLWASNGCTYLNNTKKFVSGGKYSHEINDKLTFEDFFLTDKIVSIPESSNWGNSILNNKKYLNFTTMKNVNMLEGQTYMGLLSYKNNEKMNSKLSFGASNSLSKDTITPCGEGVALNYENTFQINKDNLLKSSVFAYSPNFYSAGSATGSGCFLSDRVGVSVGGGTKLKNTVISGGYTKYKSNFGAIYEGGLMDFDEYNFLARTTFKKAPSILLRMNAKKGANGLGEITSSSYELSTNKRIKCFNISSGIRSNTYSNKYNREGFSSYNSQYSSTYSDINFPIGKSCGSGSLGHELVTTTSDTTNDSYKTIRMGYSTPSIKGISLSFLSGYHYTGLNKGLDFGASIIKRLQSGSAVSLNYRFNRSPCYIVDNMYIPSNIRHSITVDFSELYGVSNGGLQSLGTNNLNKGYLQASAFLDVNKNGVKDKDEPEIENIAFKLENDSDAILTTKNGSTKLKPEDPGIHRIEIFEDELPTFLSVHNKTSPTRYIKINEKEKTEVSFGLISSVGNVNGSVTVKDEFNTPIKINDIIVSIIGSEGEEVNYTNLNEDGTFSISGLNPGKYIVAIDKELQEAYHLSPEAASENFTIEIPPEYKDYVTIDNVNLYYKYSL